MAPNSHERPAAWSWPPGASYLLALLSRWRAAGGSNSSSSGSGASSSSISRGLGSTLRRSLMSSNTSSSSSLRITVVAGGVCLVYVNAVLVYAFSKSNEANHGALWFKAAKAVTVAPLFLVAAGMEVLRPVVRGAARTTRYLLVDIAYGALAHAWRSTQHALRLVRRAAWLVADTGLRALVHVWRSCANFVHLVRRAAWLIVDLHLQAFDRAVRGTARLVRGIVRLVRPPLRWTARMLVKVCLKVDEWVVKLGTKIGRGMDAIVNFVWPWIVYFSSKAAGALKAIVRFIGRVINAIVTPIVKLVKWIVRCTVRAAGYIQRAVKRLLQWVWNWMGYLGTQVNKRMCWACSWIQYFSCQIRRFCSWVWNHIKRTAKWVWTRVIVRVAATVKRWLCVILAPFIRMGKAIWRQVRVYSAAIHAQLVRIWTWYLARRKRMMDRLKPLLDLYAEVKAELDKLLAAVF